MKRKRRIPRLSPAMVVACLAFFIAVGGVGYAALRLPKNSVKSKQIKNGQVKTVDLNANAKAPRAGLADNASHLGGEDPTAFQGFCEAGAIKGSVVFNGTLSADSDFQTVPGFNCSPGGVVQIRRTAAQGDYRIRFLPNTGGSGSAVVSSKEYTRECSTVSRTDDPKAPGETVFQVLCTADDGTDPQNTVNFTLLAF